MIIRDKIFLRKKRDFGDMFSTVFKLLRRNFGVICGSVIVVGGPFILLTGIAAAMMNMRLATSLDITSIFMKSNPTQFLSDLITNSYGWVLLAVFFGLLSFSFIRAAMGNFFVIYDSKLEGEEITVNEIARKSYKDGLRVFLGSFLLLLITLVPAALIFIPLGLLMGANAAGGAVIAFFLLFFGALAFGPQLVYIFTFGTWFSMVRDRVFLFKGIRNVFKTISGNFWWTWVLMICMYFVVALLSWLLANVPLYIFQQIANFNMFMREPGDVSISYIIVFTITQFAAKIIFCLGDLMVGVSYYSFEEEKTGMGISMRIDEIGKQEENPNYI